MAALLVLALVVAVIVAMERTDRRVRAEHRLPEIDDRDIDRTRADLAAHSPAQAAGATHVGAPARHSHLRLAAFR
ncbi:hypothetical protein [Luteipulveratus halotolerans]|uniref:Uncharacterized protein n=1 Tax=Luteipulveratus halotolerans TaxID=1631356 RepID=A0A0L6CLY6_9MICO|nr:hypothetical protein [Luteipulveratus halotolerans]KNX38533.1 hypothetical protein VV01_17470 [Luteipulveratus halotolerans]